MPAPRPRSTPRSRKALVNTQRAAIPPLEQTLTQNRNALAVLMARSPESVRVRGGSLRSIAYPRVTPGLPSELLTQRPDIREAEANLAAANANVENARAQMLPSITLTGEGGYQSAMLKILLRPESVFFNVAAGLTQPIFDGLKLQGNLDLQKGQQDELLQNYRKAVISGFADVETALDGIQQTALRETAAARRGDELAARLRYFRAAPARGHGRSGHRAANPADALSGAGRAGAGAARARAGDREPLSGARRRLVAEAGGSLQCTVNCRSRSGPRPAAAIAASWRSG